MSQNTQTEQNQSQVEPGRVAVLYGRREGRPAWASRLELAGFELMFEYDAKNLWNISPDTLLVDFGSQSNLVPVIAEYKQQFGTVSIVGILRSDGETSRIDALRAGADAVLEEPVNEEELLAMVQVRVSQQRKVVWALTQQQRTNAMQCQLTEFLVHDLKNPLATILTNLHLLEGRLDSEIPIRFASEAQAAGRRLERMLVNMLDLSYREAGRLELELMVVRLDDFVEEAVFAVRPLGVPRGIRVEPELGELSAVTVEVDFDMMTRVLINLLENAIRHSPDDGSVAVRTSVGDGCFLLCVDDRGEGVPESERDRIFGKFVRINTEVQKRSGHGLGLAFVRMVAEAHNLEIGVDTGPDGGGRFFIKFPLKSE